MNIIYINELTSFFLSVEHYFLNLDPAYMDIFKIFAGSIGWIGGLTLYMWFRERKAKTVRI